MLINEFNILEYAKNHPDMTLEGFSQMIKEQEAAFIKQAKETEENNKQWIIDNLCDHDVLFKMESGYRVLHFSLDNDEIKVETIFSFGSIDHMCHNIKSQIFRLVSDDDKATFNLKWIKTPYNNGPMTYSAYVIPPEKMNEINTNFTSFITYYKDLLNFQNSDYAVKTF